MRFFYAVQIQPRGGNQLREFTDVEITFDRRWSAEDAVRYRDATRQLWPGAALIVDSQNLLYAVDENEITQ